MKIDLYYNDLSSLEGTVKSLKSRICPNIEGNLFPKY